MTKEQEKVWDNIAEEWHELKTQDKEKQGQHVLNFLEGKKGKILDLGSGSGRYLRNVKEGKMYLSDFSGEMINLAKEKAKKEKINAEFSVAEMTKLPYENDFFDYAIASSSFHCLNPEEQKESVKELFRVLKKGGEAEISVWNIESSRFKNSPKEKMIKWHDKGARYYYLFSPEEIYSLFEKAGFKIIEKEQPRMMIVFTVKKA